jgi:hypothetical protein
MRTFTTHRWGVTSNMPSAYKWSFMGSFLISFTKVNSFTKNKNPFIYEMNSLTW